MSTNNSNNKVKQIVAKAKSVPLSAYLLIALNIIAITALVCEDLPLHYVIGLGLFAICLITLLGQAIGCCSGPSSLISGDVSARIKQLQERVLNYAKTLNASELQSKSVNVIIAVICPNYFRFYWQFTQVRSSTQLLVNTVMNVAYCFVFLPKQSDSVLNCCKQCCGSVLKKIQYQS